MQDNNSNNFLLYSSSQGEVKVDVLLKDETIWLTINQMAELFGIDKSGISRHIKNVFETGELDKNSVVAKNATTASDGKTYQMDFYNLDMIISVGYRVKSKQGTQFRIWATQRLKEYIIKGFALNDDRFKTGNSMNCFNELQTRIREIRISERFFYQKIKDIYTTSIDYNAKDENTLAFFKIVQNKLLWAISQQTAAELVYRRTDANLPLLGMQSYDKENSGKIKKREVSVAKNYLKEAEIKLLGLIVEQYLAFAETMALENTPMYMKDWVQRLDIIVQLNGKELLTHAGEISHQMALENQVQNLKNIRNLKNRLKKKIA